MRIDDDDKVALAAMTVLLGLVAFIVFLLVLMGMAIQEGQIRDVCEKTGKFTAKHWSMYCSVRDE